MDPHRDVGVGAWAGSAAAESSVGLHRRRLSNTALHLTRVALRAAASGMPCGAGAD